jgi:hypothetical protein
MAKPRKTSPRTKGIRKVAAASEALKAKWRDDPVWAAKMRAKLADNAIRRGINPERMARTRVPDGMRRRDAVPLWEEAKKKADWVMKQLEEEGLLPAVEVPDSDEGKAQVALHETCVLAFGPGEVRNKLQALRTVLEYTKVKPVTKIDQRVSSAEAFLQTALDDLKSSQE